MNRKYVLVGLLVWTSLGWTAHTNADVRVATYNIRRLKENVNTTRKQKLLDVIEHLNADVIGLQEIDDRAALRKIFPQDQWQLLIDDDSGFDEDVALVVRKPLHLIDHFDQPDIDAGPDDFLFPDDATHNTAFPHNRDALFGEIHVCDSCPTLTVVVIHAKARPDCRSSTDARRELGASQLVSALDRFEDRFFVVLGDFNDNPDDRSMNILETGNSDAAAGPENEPGSFLINLTEPLLLEDRVSWGLKSNAVVTTNEAQVTDTRKSGSRAKNNEQRETCGEATHILFDQLLIPAAKTAMYLSNSIHIFDHPSGVEGNDSTRASDHLSVYADFIFEPSDDQGGGAGSGEVTGVRIRALLPNPDGSDSGNEMVTLTNGSGPSVDLTHWKLQDSADHSVLIGNLCAANGISCTLSSGQEGLRLQLPQNVLPLTNGGDTIDLLNPDGTAIHSVSYSKAQAQSGVELFFN